MLTAIGFVPATPLLVPELGGAAASELSTLRTRVLAVAGEVAARCERWTVLGVQAARETPAQRSLAGAGVGTFAGFGVDVRVSLGDVAVGAVAGDALEVSDDAMPLPLLIAGWLRAQVGAEAEIAAELVEATAGRTRCLAAGRDLAERLARSGRREGVLVVADGPTTLTAAAPGALDPRAAALDERLRAAFETGDVSALAGLDETLCAELGAEGRAPWQVLAGLLGEGPVDASGVFADAPYGVGYHTALWTPAGVGEQRAGGPA